MVEFGFRRFEVRLFGGLDVIKLIMLINKSGVVLFKVCVRLMIVFVRISGVVKGRIW